MDGFKKTIKKIHYLIEILKEMLMDIIGDSYQN